MSVLLGTEEEDSSAVEMLIAFQYSVSVRLTEEIHLLIIPVKRDLAERERAKT